MHWSVCFPVLILVGTGWWTWQAYLSDPPWYAYPIAAGIALRCLIWLWQCRKQPPANQTFVVTESGAQALIGPSFGSVKINDGSVQL